MSRKRGFTLIELLVVVAIIAILIAILLPSLGRAKETTNRAICAANLKAQGQAFAMYATQFNDAIPNFKPGDKFNFVSPPYTVGTYGLNWWWDQTHEFRDVMAVAVSTTTTSLKNTNGLRKIFYCPSNTRQNDDFLWNLTNAFVAGYQYLNDRGTQSGGYLQVGGGGDTALQNATTVANVKRGTPLAFRKRWSNTPRSSSAEMAMDATLSNLKLASSINQNFSWINGAFQGHSTNHLERNLPSGSNTLCCDGHVEWRPFSFTLSVAVGSNGGGAPYFWWPEQSGK